MKRKLPNTGSVSPSEVEKVEWRANRDTAFHKKFLFDLKGLAEMPPDEALEKKALASLIETVEYSDPRGIPESNFYEEMLLDAVRKIKRNGIVTNEDVENLSKLFESRTNALKAWK